MLKSKPKSGVPVSKKGVLVATVLLILSSLSAHYFDIVDLPLIPSNFKLNSFKLPPNFEISADPQLITLKSVSGSSNITVIKLRSNSNYRTNLTLIVEHAYASFFGIFDEIKFSFSTNHIFLPAKGEEQSILTIKVHSSITPGKYYIDVIGNAGEIKRSVRITMIVIL